MKRMTSKIVSDGRNEGLRQMLLEKKREIQKQIDELIIQRREEQERWRGEPAMDDQDMAYRDSSADQIISLLEVRHRMRITLDEALTRLQEGTYGVCKECGEPVSRARLKALPFAKTCIECQNVIEGLEKLSRV
ncbi:MAG: TraR/DksA family transcriptional regulator [Nitrospirales bacterium]